MEINKVIVGNLFTNCYILSIDNKCIVIDPGDEYNKIKKIIGDKEVVGVIITHNHFDHIGAINNFDKSIVFDYHNLKEKHYDIDKFSFDIIYTPGHKEDSITIYFDEYNVMFTGDFIFKNSIGRMDLEGGNTSDMKKSLEKIKKYDKNIIIYPGHGDNTKLGSEINYFNYYL